MYNKKSKLSAKEVAIQYLSRRDHGEFELQHKLKLKQFSDEDITQALAYCQTNGWLDDLRYAKSQIRQHVYKGHGEKRIRQALNSQRVADEVIEQALLQEPQDWFELAKQVAEKKFKGIQAVDAKAHAKQVRYLLYRGYSYEQINYALQKSD